MRTITIDLSDTCPKPQKVFAGFAGEHNATNIEIILPKEMVLSSSIKTFYPLFCTEWNEQYVGAPILSTGSATILVPIHRALTRKGYTSVQIEGRDLDNNLIAKSPVGLLKFDSSVDSDGEELGLIVQDMNEIQSIINGAIGPAIIAAEIAEASSDEAKQYADKAEEYASVAQTTTTEVKSRVEHMAVVLSENRLLHNIEGENWEPLGSDEEVTAYTLINDVRVNLLTGRYYDFSIITPKSGDFAILRANKYGEFLLTYSDDRYVGKIVLPNVVMSISGWVVEIQNPTGVTASLSATAPIVVEEEILPDRVKVYLDDLPVWEESTNDEATQYNQGIMHVMDKLELSKDKEYSLSCNIGVTITNASFQHPYIILVKKTINGEFLLLDSKTAIVNNGVASGELKLRGGVEQGELLYLSLTDTSGGLVKFDTSSSEVFIEWVSNTKEILDYLSLKGGSNENLGDIEAALDGIIAIQNNLIGGGSV